ncbi:MAG: (2Fe-2S)-binding protein [Proteobacteria bacterium]|nr:(2Fe-2S)-binding protein [Pseudomonadota bacterium]
MYVCICNAITDTMIRQAAADGVGSLSELTRRTGCSGDCGSCAGLAEDILRKAQPRSVARFNFKVPLIAAQAA